MNLRFGFFSTASVSPFSSAETVGPMSVAALSSSIFLELSRSQFLLLYRALFLPLKPSRLTLANQ